jgi:hypothetical protein
VTNDHQLMQFHIDALFTSDANGDLVRVNEPNGAPAPRFFLGRTTAGLAYRFRHDTDASTRRELEARAQADLVAKHGLDAIDPLPYAEILSGSGSIRSIDTGPAFGFPADLRAPSDVRTVTGENASILEPHFRSWLPDVGCCQPMVAVAIGDEAVSLCATVRVTSNAHEAGVETAPPHRGRGYALAAARGWARAVRALNIIPLYSTSWTNEASRSVARKLGLIQFGSDLHVT